MPALREISVDETDKTISLDILNSDRVVWIKDGDEYAEGLSFNYSQLKDAIVRAQVHLGELTSIRRHPTSVKTLRRITILPRLFFLNFIDWSYVHVQDRRY